MYTHTRYRCIITFSLFKPNTNEYYSVVCYKYFQACHLSFFSIFCDQVYIQRLTEKYFNYISFVSHFCLNIFLFKSKIQSRVYNNNNFQCDVIVTIFHKHRAACKSKDQRRRVDAR